MSPSATRTRELQTKKNELTPLNLGRRERLASTKPNRVEKRHQDKYDFIYKPALIYEHIDTKLDNDLLADRRVRQAILMAIDRKAISDKLFEGKQPVADGPVSPLDPMYSPVARQYPYDPAVARKLLDEAGFADSKNGARQNAKGEHLSIEITTTAGNRVRELVAQVIQSQLRQ